MTPSPHQPSKSERTCPSCKVELRLGDVDGKPTWICPSCWRPVESQESAQIGAEAKRSKYGAKKTEVDGYLFDSKREAERYKELKILEGAGLIARLRLQPLFVCKINDKQVCNYSADFQYFDRRISREVIEDVKSPATRVKVSYRIKKKLVEALHGIEIREVGG